MKLWKILCIASVLMFGASFVPGDEPKEVPKEKVVDVKADKPDADTFTTHRISVKRANGQKFTAHFYDHAAMKKLKANGKMLDAKALPAVTIPFDYAKGIQFPMLGNDQVGDCFYASACHHDQTMTGNWSSQSMFTLSAVLSRYRSLSGGDNGLADSDIQGEWKGRYLADVKEAKILDWLYIDTTDVKAIQSAMWHFGGTQFTFTVPNGWFNHSNTGDIWDSPQYTNNNNGHAVHWNGVDANGNYRLQTWGTYVWITPRAVKVCNPDGFVVFSTRWFDPKTGYAPNGKHITELASIWTAGGGKTIAKSVIDSFPPIAVVPPVPVPPTPAPSGPNFIDITENGVTRRFLLVSPARYLELTDVWRSVFGMAP